MRNRRGKLAALSGASCVAVILALGLLVWEDLACRYYLFRVRQDVTYLETLYNHRGRSSVQKAIQEFTREPTAEEAWLGVLVEREQGEKRLDTIQRLGALDSAGAVKTLSTLLPDDQDQETIFAATAALVECGPTAIPALWQSLRQSGEDAVFLRLQAISSKGLKAVIVLRDLLGHPRTDVRSSAAESLGELGRVASSAAPDLLIALKDPHNYVREEAATALGELGVVSDQIVSALCTSAVDDDLNVSMDSCEALSKLGPEAVHNAVPFLRTLLTEGDHEVQAKAAYACADLGPWVSSQVVDELVPLLRVRDDEVRWNTLYAITQAGTSAASAVPELVPLLDDDDEAVADVVEALAAIGTASVPALREATGSDRVRLRSNAVDALGKIGREANAAIPNLLNLIKQDPSPQVRAGAALSLGSIGVDPSSCIPRLLEALKDGDPQVRLGATTSLSLFGDSGLPFVCDALLHEDESVRLIAVTSLGEFGPKAETAVPRLTDLIESEPNSLTRSLAVVTLGKIGPGAATAVPALLRMSEGSDYHARSWVLEALGRIGPKAHSAIPTLTAALGDKSNLVRKAAKKALERVQAP